MTNEKLLEVWKPVVGYEGLYEVSSFGGVRSVDYTIVNSRDILHNRKGRPLSLKNDSGYIRATLYKNKYTKVAAVHRLVALAFIPNPDNKPVVNHKDFDKSNNNVGNLEWCTDLENVRHSHSHGRLKIHKFTKEDDMRSAEVKRKDCFCVKNGIRSEFTSLTDMAIFIKCAISSISTAIRRGTKIYGHNVGLIGKELAVSID